MSSGTPLCGLLYSRPVVAGRNRKLAARADLVWVVELFNAMREQSKDPAVLAGAKERSLSSAAALGPDISPSTSHYFEVFYIGKIKVTHKRVPDTFIDDALQKFRAHEAEKERLKAQKTSGNNINNSCGSNSNNKTESSSTLNNANANNNMCSNSIADSTTISNNGNCVATCDGSAITVANSNSNPSVKTCKNNNVIEQNECNPEAIKRNAQEEANFQDKSSSAESLITRSMSDVNAASEITSKRCDEAVRSESGCVTPSLENPVAPVKQLPPLEPMRARAASAGSARDFRKGDSAVSSDNRTMLFLVGRVDLRLISPDRKQTLLHKHLKDVASCIQGISNPEHFGFICREANVEGFIAYVFKCESASVADDVVGAITQAFVATSEAQRRERMPVFSCDHCPMVWYSRLCAEIEGQNEKRTQTTILRRLEGLPEAEQESILTKFGGAETQGLQEQNEFLMMLLRAHCESKQARHVHDTAENRHEFLNQYLGGSTIFMKAKRSLTNSFDQLLKRKGSRDDLGPMLKEMSLPSNATLWKESISNTSSRASPTSEQAEPVPDSPNATSQRIRHAASGSNSDLHCAGIHQKDSPMKNIFLKVGSSPISPGKDTTGNSRQSGSWRQSIFDSVTPKKVRPDGSPVVLDGPQKLTKRDRAELRALWRKAINQQLLLIRMERENARLRARQEEATVKRLKLEYDEIGSCVRELVEVWDLLLSRESAVSTRCDRQMLLQAIKQGVPRTKRGEVWQFLADQYCLNHAPPDTSKFPNYNVPYEGLLKQLTAHQHVILIDLGRTFPSHPFFSRPLGPGQLSLFNLLKAYSLLDPEVGYCQGLSFVAGVLLLHMSEECAFLMLRHLMLQRGMRRQYVPDMGALQVQLYQISRLLRDTLPDLYAHFDTHDIAPTLYAAPWVLTLFASQFPLGFVVRIFDLLFFESTDVVVRVAVALLNEHREGLLACDNFEEIMDYLKGKVPSIDKATLDRIMKQVFTSDVSKQLHDYEVEYHVLKEEMASPRVDMETVHRLEAENRNLIEQLEIATSATHRQQQTINKLEAQVRSLEVSITTMGNFISELVDTRKDIEIPGEVRRLIQQVAVVERRKSTTQKPKIEALKTPAPSVIETPATEVQRSSSAADELSSQHRGHAPYPLKSALSSPNLSARLSGVSSLFSNTHNNNKQQKPNAVATSSGSTKAYSQTSDIRHMGQKMAQPNGIVKTERQQNAPETIKTLSDTSTLKSESPLASKPKPLRPSQSSYELTTPIVKLVDDSGDSGNVTPTSPSTQVHPLDSCLGVNFSFSGTTKLKTIRPLRANLQRNPSSESLKINPGTDGLNIVNLRPKEQQPLVVGVNPQSNGVLTSFSSS
ncbi:TBC1 domain family member 4 isoform X3 [Schistocerca gregaria]|uniref:TBC1 domain family member 4 isoform X3 n=1 Tax=Schistocerca gregaria TaxID=7010 RepID=UPI00211DC532|nr:TBC1 domain family member 4 isoform X3 [Schistocerca gregaria]